MQLPILNYCRFSQLLREDISLFIKEESLIDIDVIQVLQFIKGKLGIVNFNKDQKLVFLVKRYLSSPYSYEVLTNQEVLYVFKILLNILQEKFKCFSSIFDFNILTTDGGIITKFEYSQYTKLIADKHVLQQEVTENIDVFEGMIEVIKSQVSPPILAFELKNMDSVIYEYSLLDEFGYVKPEIKMLIYNNLLIKDIPRELLPPIFYRKIKENPNHSLASASIQELLNCEIEGPNKYFNKVSQPILRAYYNFVDLVDNNLPLYYLTYMRQLPIPLLGNIDVKADILTLLDILIAEVQIMAEFGYFDIKEIRSIEYVTAYFEGESLEDLAVRYGLSSERVRQIIKTESVYAQIFNGKSNIYLWKGFYESLESFKAEYLFNDLITNVIPDEDLTVLKNKFYFLGLDLFEIKINNQIKYFLTDISISSVRNYVNSFIQFSKNFYLAKDFETFYQDFIAYYKVEGSKGYDETLSSDKALFEKILKCSFIESKYIEGEEEAFYVIDWNLLASMDLRIASILFDVGEIMTREEILKEYNLRCIYYGEEPLPSVNKLHIRSIDNIRKIRNDVWKYSEDFIDVQDNTQSLISEFLTEKGGVASLEEIKAKLLTLDRSYKENSLRAFILMVATISKDDRNLFVHNDMIDQVDIEVMQKRNSMIGAKILPVVKEELLQISEDLEIKDFTKKVKDRVNSLDISNSRNFNVPYYLELFCNGSAIQIEDKKILYAGIDREKIENIKYRDEPAYREAIRNAAVVLFKENENKPIRIINLWNSLNHLYPIELSRNNFYKIFENSSIFNKSMDNAGKPTYSLVIEKLPESKPFTEAVHSPDEFVGQVIDTPHMTVDSYRKIQNVTWTNDLLFDFIYNDLSVQLKNQNWNFDAGFEGFKSIFVGKEGEPNVWGNSLLSSVGRVLMNVSDYYDRDTCMQRLSLSFESYLRLLLKDNHSKGLGNLIQGNTTLSILKNYKYVHDYKERNKTLLSFSNKLNNLIYYRNIYAHDPNSDKVQISLVDHIRNIMDFISLYIFVAAALDV